jgi:hypothetical protein
MVYLYRETQSSISSCYRRKCCTVLQFLPHSLLHKWFPKSPSCLLWVLTFYNLLNKLFLSSECVWMSDSVQEEMDDCVSLYKYTISCLLSYLMVNSVRICRILDIIAISWLQKTKTHKKPAQIRFHSNLPNTICKIKEFPRS